MSYKITYLKFEQKFKIEEQNEVHVRLPQNLCRRFSFFLYLLCYKVIAYDVTIVMLT